MTMQRARWQQLSACMDEALALRGAARAAWMAALRSQDPALAAELARLLPPEVLQCGRTVPGLPAADARGQPGDDHGNQDNSGRRPPATTQVRAMGVLQAFDHQLVAALAPAAAGDATQAGQHCGPWRLVEKIGEGGMGQVWLAERDDGLYQARAAIKLLRGDLTSAAGLPERFARERAVLARLNHPAVARLLDAGVAQHGSGQAYLVLEHVAGVSLAEHARSRCRSLAMRVRLLLRIAQAVEHAHAQLIVHRDLKPSNVLVTPDGAPKLLDFGIAGLLDAGESVDTDLTRQTGRGLTLGYAAPEQIQAAPIGTAADVFSLGVMLFELITGELPFAPRGAPRMAVERAVLHDEPRRMATLLAGQPSDRSTGPAAAADPDPGPGPGRAADARQALGDLEAVAAKALRKLPADRYASVGAFTDDLQRWLDHRPVSARRDDWRHRTRLWLRRNAMPAAAAAVVVASLSAGLAGATWQWQRAQAAARQSDGIARYLGDLLASASPDQHGGQWPTVLQLLQESRFKVSQAFPDDPDTRMRLLTVMADTYHQLNRFDLSLPMVDELVALATARHQPMHPVVLQARMRQARALQIQGLFDKAIAVLEPLRQPFADHYGARSEELRGLLYVLSTSYTRSGRLDEADRMLNQAGELTAALHGRDGAPWMSHLNHVQVLRVGQGRLTEALAAMRATEPFWRNTELHNAREILVFRRNTLAVQIRLSEHDGIEDRVQPLLADMERLMGAGNDMATGLRAELARYYAESGQRRLALQQRQDNLARARAAGVQLPAVLLPMQVQVLLARALALGHGDEPGAAGGTPAGPSPAAALARDVRSMLVQMQAHGRALGYGRADAWLALARVGLVLDDALLTAEALAPLKADAALGLERDQLLASRLAQIEGGLARLRGDLAVSRDRLTERLRLFDRPGADRRVLAAWVAALDLAYTLVLMNDPAAARALDHAAERRPLGLARSHVLDSATIYLQARLQAQTAAAGGAGGPAVDGSTAAAAAADAALQALVQQQQRWPGVPPGPGLGSLAGALSPSGP